jgi:uncharacterized iron-regulated membrane protein
MSTSDKKFSIRFWINQMHLWLGLASAIIFFLVCATGTIYVFKKEIEHMLEPGKYEVAYQDQAFKMSLEEQIAFVEKETKGKASRISIDSDPTKSIEIQIHKGKEDKRGLTHYVNPYEMQLLGTAKGPASEFFMTVFKMHRWLTFDTEVGRPIVGVATLIFVLLSISGLALWIPKKWKKWKNYKAGYRIKWKASWKRLNHDLHNVLGFYAFPIILIMALTGLNWSFEWYKDGLGKVLGAEVFAGKKPLPFTSTPSGDSSSIKLNKVFEIAQAELNYKGKTVVGLPKGEDGVFNIRKTSSERLNKEATDMLILDQYNGKIIEKQIFDNKRFGEKIASQIQAIHMGETHGLFSKIIYFFCCLIATSLPVTGIFIWINKMKKTGNGKQKRSLKSLTPNV